MNFMLKAVWVTAIVALSVSQVSEEKIHKNGSEPSSGSVENACDDCGKILAAPPCTCAITRIHNLGGGVYLYYAEFNESDCDSPQPVYLMGNYGQYPHNHICENNPNACESTPASLTSVKDTIPHAISHDPSVPPFSGLDKPWPPDQVIDAGTNVVAKSSSWVKYEIEELHVTYKAKLWRLSVDLTDDGNQQIQRTVYAAFEVERFPDGEEPVVTKLSDRMVKRCQGNYAFSTNEGGRRVLLLIAKTETSRQ